MAYTVDHKAVKLVYLAVFLEGVYERGRGKHTVFRILPPCESFRADDPSVLNRNYRLIEYLDVLITHCRIYRVDYMVTQVERVFKLVVVLAEFASVVFLYAVAGEPCSVAREDGVGIIGRRPVRAAFELYLYVALLILYLLRNTGDGAFRTRRGSQHHKMIVRETGGERMSECLFYELCRFSKQLIALCEAVGLVIRLEILDIEKQESKLAASGSIVHHLLRFGAEPAHIVDPGQLVVLGYVFEVTVELLKRLVFFCL